MDSVKLQSKTIDALRFPLAVLVVYIHSKITAENTVPDWDNYQAADIFITVQILISNVIAHVSVPLFYVVSGFLFFYKLDGFTWDIYVSKLRKRWNTLAVPYLLWNTLLILWVLMKKVAGVIVKGKPLSGITDWFADKGYLSMFWDCEMWNVTKCNWLGQLTPHITDFSSVLVFERFDSSCSFNTYYLCVIA